MKNRSFAFPVLLIGVGALFLVNNAMPELSVWKLLSDWWPVLLIAFGAIRLLEVLAAAGTGRAVNAAARPMGFGWIVAAVLIGLAFTVPRHLGQHWRMWPISASTVTLFGEPFNYPVDANSPAGDAKRLVIDGVRGNITVTGGAGTNVHMEGQKTIRAFDRKSADAVNGQTSVAFVREEDALILRATPAPGASDAPQPAVDVEITIPKGMSLEARGRSGDLTVESLDGSVDISSQRGEVRLQDVGGSAKLEVEHSDLVRADNVRGEIDLQGSGRDVQMDNVQGQVTINGSFSGTLDFKELAKPLHFESGQTDLRVEKTPGSISMSLGQLRASNVTGPIRFVTHERDVDLDDFTGPLDIDLSHGDIDLKPTKDTPLARIDVHSRNGNVEMALPPSGFDLKATSKQGDVENDFGDGVVSESGEGRSNSLHSASPSGALITLNTERGEISVRKLE